MDEVAGNSAGSSQTTAGQETAGKSPESLRQDAQANAGPDASPDAVGPDTGILCLAMMLQFHKTASDPSQLAHEYGPVSGTIDLLGLVRAAKQIGLKARSGTLKMKRLVKSPLPAIAEAADGSFFVLARANDEKVLIQRPGSPPEILIFTSPFAR